MTKGFSEASAMWIAIVAELMLQKTLQRAYPHRTHTGHVQARSIEKTPTKSPNIWETALVCHFFVLTKLVCHFLCPTKFVSQFLLSDQVCLSFFVSDQVGLSCFLSDQVGLPFFVSDQFGLSFLLSDQVGLPLFFVRPSWFVNFCV